MHLLFLGITKSTMKRIMEWTKQTNKYNSFLRLASGLLEHVAKLHVGWCVALPISGMNLGVWVSENYLGMSCLFRWFFSFSGHLKEGPQYQDPIRPYTTWSVKELREWLQVRGLPSKGEKLNWWQKLDSYYHKVMFLYRYLPKMGVSVMSCSWLYRIRCYYCQHYAMSSYK